jgi:hypothetical protein
LYPEDGGIKILCSVRAANVFAELLESMEDERKMRSK